MHLSAPKISGFCQEAWRCLAVIVFFLVGGAMLLAWTGAVGGCEWMFRNES